MFSSRNSISNKPVCLNSPHFLEISEHKDTSDKRRLRKIGKGYGYRKSKFRVLEEKRPQYNVAFINRSVESRFTVEIFSFEDGDSLMMPVWKVKLSRQSNIQGGIRNKSYFFFSNQCVIVVIQLCDFAFQSRFFVLFTSFCLSVCPPGQCLLLWHPILVVFSSTIAMAL